MGEVYKKIQSLANKLLRHTHAFPFSFSSLTYGFLRASVKNDGLFRTAKAEIRQVYFCFCHKNLPKSGINKLCDMWLPIVTRTETFSSLLFHYSTWLLLGVQNGCSNYNYHFKFQLAGRRKEQRRVLPFTLRIFQEIGHGISLTGVFLPVGEKKGKTDIERHLAVTTTFPHPPETG